MQNEKRLTAWSMAQRSASSDRATARSTSLQMDALPPFIIRH